MTTKTYLLQGNDEGYGNDGWNDQGNFPTKNQQSFQNNSSKNSFRTENKTQNNDPAKPDNKKGPQMSKGLDGKQDDKSKGEAAKKQEKPEVTDKQKPKDNFNPSNQGKSGLCLNKKYSRKQVLR